ncbi:b(o/a)3-type cytochrome-c oxidase subunit 1 [Numidum massiliense]|uniref:b(o/a)3-type cytochrome-c oxidase subunit 1 n=1 Tax=Numidum massiliense TaxID=1522315 RepID=UPI0006D54330|nr:b(o/a)3-type cytochrome-c oxidase subunit 1 [Numidum massiliense]
MRDSVQSSEQFQGFERQDARLGSAHLVVAFTALLIGGICGLLQALDQGGMVNMPSWIGYYQLLTAHGVLLALVTTTFFIIGFIYAGLARVLGGKLIPATRRYGWIGFVLMTVGTIMATVMILANKATVLYTFYAPMQASPWFYIGLALLVVGSWSSGIGVFLNYRHYRHTHPGKTSPLLSFMAVATFIMWFVASIGVAIEVVVQLIPWSFGWVETVNVLLSRTLFWFFGHPLVYFWLLPAYMIWYVCLPKIVGGKIFSDALARLAFVLFIMFSIPVGFHHQLTEPGVAQGWKFLQVSLTMAVVVPSLMTAFSMFATFESVGRAKGARGLFGWLKVLPWNDVRFLAPFIAMLLFIPGGAGGIINASNQMNQVVHNTMFITGHFHLAVATTVLLTFFGAAYWLIPALTNRRLTPAINKLGIVQTILWTVGMLIMSGAMHIVGLLGAPRRTSFTDYQGSAVAADWVPYKIAMGVGGAILFVAIILMVYIVIHLFLFAPKGKTDFVVSEVAEGAQKTPMWLEHWPVWVGLIATLILIAYVSPVIHIIEQSPPGSLPFVTW